MLYLSLGTQIQEEQLTHKKCSWVLVACIGRYIFCWTTQATLGFLRQSTHASVSALLSSTRPPFCNPCNSSRAHTEEGRDWEWEWEPPLYDLRFSLYYCSSPFKGLQLSVFYDKTMVVCLSSQIGSISYPMLLLLVLCMICHENCLPTAQRSSWHPEVHKENWLFL